MRIKKKKLIFIYALRTNQCSSKYYYQNIIDIKLYAPQVTSPNLMHTFLFLIFY